MAVKLEFECKVKENTAYSCGASKHCGYGRCETCGWESEDGAIDPLTLEPTGGTCPICGGRVLPYCGYCESPEL